LYRIAAQIIVRWKLCHMAQMPADHPFGILNFGHCDLFDICDLLFEFF